MHPLAAKHRHTRQGGRSCKQGRFHDIVAVLGFSSRNVPRAQKEGFFKFKQI